ncbi:hypothetical protein KBTX_03427 [wastewater metagenome]|uniref:CRISPR type III-associated protein domain-containing protein n=2 Tax=unclassified sequences TaxID=12908 RepID=A0A5B8RHL6_9ZZZZ|nr:type III-B CRISPR module RAMP protein Cmr6 [Arhodomonas sp. KWT]QEA07082.1 hypothetical protein KBTEX_03427 [uncultured organism]
MATAAQQGRAAVPAYLGTDFRDAAPGHRFYLYLRLWKADWTKINGGASDDLVRLTDDDRARMKALAERQRSLAEEAAVDESATVVTVPGTSLAPFTTGLGIEHPLENGFAFLTPYGLPYLPGSSVKGVLRQAARELDAGGAFENPDRDWGRAEIDALFGTAGADDDRTAGLERRRGALLFWDVFPVLPEGAHLQWEIMTPHHGGYHQDRSGRTPPHDNAAPVPIHFLTVPPGSAFRFTVQCNRALLETAAPGLLEGDRWRTVLEELFDHAFTWLGFGAKTAVGYGEMAVDEKARRHEEEHRRKRAEEARKEAERAEMPAGERLASEMLEGKADPDQAEYRYLLDRLDAGEVPDEHVPAFATVVRRWLEQRRQEVRKLGNRRRRQSRLSELDEHEARLRSFLGE